MYGAEIVAAGIGALGSVGSALASGAANSKWTYNQLRTLHEYEKENAELAYQRQQELAAGYTPAAMVKKYREAGLNPALMSEFGGSPGSVDSGSTSAGAGAGSSPYDFQGIFPGIVSAFQAAKSSQVQDEQARLLRQQGISEEISNNFKVQKELNSLLQQQAEIRSKLSDSDLSEAQRFYYEQQSDSVGLGIKMMLQTWDDQAQSYKLNNINTQSQIDANNARAALDLAQSITEQVLRPGRVELNRAQAASLYQGIKESLSRIDLNKALSDTEAQKVTNMVAEKVGIDNNNKLYPLLRDKIHAEIERLRRIKLGEWIPDDPFGMRQGNRPYDGKTSDW